jgi:probable F420-dependent oxidoreductase
MVEPATNVPTIRFGLQVNPGVGDIDRIGAEAEASGFDVITTADHVRPGGGSPMITLARLAGATSTIGLGTMVINNDMRNPVQLAWEAVTLHRLSGGRFELGLGAGHSTHEYAETGIPFDGPPTRKARLREATEIIAALTRGDTVDYEGDHYQLTGATVIAPEDVTTPLPILVGGNGTALLTHAARHADIIGLQGLGRTLEDGHRHTVKFGFDHLEAQLGVIEEARGDRTVELAALVQRCEITDDREAALATIAENIEGVSVAEASATPYLAVGTVDEIANHFITVRNRWGISYFTVRDPDFGPIIDRVRELDG